MENKEWTEEMRKGMEMIIHACRSNTEWIKCNECPFNVFCGILDDYAFEREEPFDTYEPMNWEEVMKEAEEDE